MESKEVLIAYNVELGRIFKVHYGLPKNPQNYTWICRNCDKPVFYNQYENCFKHRGQKPEGFEPETIEHKAMKNYWYSVFPKFNHIKSRHREYWFEDQVADVYFELRDRKKVAIECQNSPITSKKLIERTKKYTAKDIYVLWVFNGSGTCVSEEKRPANIGKIRVLKEEKRAHNLYGGRIYYMNVVGEEVIEDPYPIHFSPYFENKELETSIYGHDKYYKEFQSATVGNIFTYKILCVEYKGHKLARFMDKSVSISCTEQLLICLRELCLKKIDARDVDERGESKIAVSSIIDLVREEFGYFLPYLILKRSKRIKKVRFERLLDEKYNLQDTICVRISDYVK
ncbi:hypothetical protein ES703_109215 [subsurface metagenome]